MLRSNLYDYSNIYIVVQGTVTVEGIMMLKQEIKNYSSKILFRFDYAYRKLTTNS